MHVWLRLLGLFMATLAAAAAVVQMNDPDALHWVVGYAVSTVTSLLFVGRVLPRGLALFVAGAYTGWAIGIAEHFLPADRPWNPEDQFLAEEVREMGGLAIFALWSLAMAFLAPKRVPTR